MCCQLGPRIGDDERNIKKVANVHYFKVFSQACAFDAAYTQAVVVVVRYCTLSLSAINTKYI